MVDRINSVTDHQRSAAKIAALAFPISMACVVYANFGIRANFFVDGNLPETVRRVAAAESLFRLSVVFDVAHAIGFIVLLSALYVVLSPVNRYLALLASISKLVYVGSALLMSFSFLTVLHLASDPAYPQNLGAEAIQGLVRLNSSALWDQYYVGLVFWALSSTLFAWLWLKSRYIPAALAIFGIASSVWCLFCAVAYLLNPVAFSSVVNVWLFDMPMAIFYFTLSGWLLFKGLRSDADRPADAGVRL